MSECRVTDIRLPIGKDIFALRVGLLCSDGGRLLLNTAEDFAYLPGGAVQTGDPSGLSALLPRSARCGQSREVGCRPGSVRGDDGRAEDQRGHEQDRGDEGTYQVRFHAASR